MSQDLKFMRRALQLSRRGEALACPNPMVGAVIVKDGQIIGEGWHHGPGQPHAEVEALRACREDPKGTTLYVTLEPCNHYGRTPPCTEAIIKAGIKIVKIALLDPNRAVTGGGAARLRAAGIEVEIGIAGAEALELNRKFCHFCLKGQPWVIMKAAMSLDGKIATSSGQSQWITGEASRRLVHQLRSQVGAVLIGSGTMVQDNPELSNRLTPLASQPLKVLLDSELKVTPESNLVAKNPRRLLVFCTRKAHPAREEQLQRLGVQVVRQQAEERVDLINVMATLAKSGDPVTPSRGRQSGLRLLYPGRIGR